MGSAQLLKHFPLLLQSRLHMNKVMKKAPCGLQFSEEVMNVIGRLEKGVSASALHWLLRELSRTFVFCCTRQMVITYSEQN
jgi:hypothetical protein